MIPNEFGLSLESPNQLDTRTKVTYDLPVSTRMTLRVYDTLGRHVLTLVDGLVEAGNHTVSVDMDDLPSGMYFYRMEAGTYIHTCGSLLLKGIALKRYGGECVE
jgi:hypothetical protein